MRLVLGWEPNSAHADLGGVGAANVCWVAGNDFRQGGWAISDVSGQDMQVFKGVSGCLVEANTVLVAVPKRYLELREETFDARERQHHAA